MQAPQFLLLSSPGLLGPFVHGARKAKGLTRAELAATAEVGPRFIYDLERGKPTLRMDLVLRVMAAVGLVALVIDSESAKLVG